MSDTVLVSGVVVLFVLGAIVIAWGLLTAALRIVALVIGFGGGLAALLIWQTGVV